MSIFFATLITLSLLGLSFSAYHVLIIRDAAISAASKAALKDSPSQDRYLLKLLDDSLPELASYQVEGFGSERLVGVRIHGYIPGLGVLPSFGEFDVDVAATREHLL
ncbi:MAG: hypothetical protein K9G13_02100 [Aquiluna sp.]|nr:hypothetical protein [Aquiluna sp.]MCF8545317.1 hypothetical protein [Aquiluna sp.]